MTAQEFRTRHGDPATWSPADIEAQQNLAAIDALAAGAPLKSRRAGEIPDGYEFD